MEDNNTQIVSTREAAAVNALAAEIGAWANRKGFRKDFEDADWLIQLADVLEAPAPKEDVVVPAGSRLVDNDSIAAIRRIADRHRAMANTTKLMLMVSELSEALEGQRDGGNYDEELADLIIRALENADLNVAGIGDVIVKKMAVNEGRPHMHGRKF